MTSTPTSDLPTTRQGLRRRTTLWVAGTIGLALLLLLPVMVEAVAGRSVGALFAELQGKSRFATHDAAADVPQGDAPEWLPEQAHQIRVVASGPSSDIEGVRVDATVGRAPVPMICATTSEIGVPWDGGGDWPDLDRAARYACTDGWSLAIVTDHWYLWR